MTLMHFLRACIIIALIFIINCTNGEKAGLRNIDFHIDWIPGVDYIGYFIADEKGYYRDYGLNVNIIFGDGAENGAQLIAAGGCDLGTTTGDALVKAQHSINPLPIVAIALIFPKNPVVLVSLADDPSKRIMNLTDIKGKTIGYHSTSITYEQFRILVKKEGIKNTEYDSLEVGWGGAAELLSGEIDAVLAYTTDKPVDLEYRGEKIHELYFDSLGLKIGGQCIAIHVDSLASGTPDWVLSFVKASLKGWEYARLNPEAAIDLFYMRFAEQDKKKLMIGINKVLPLLPPKKYGISGYIINHDDVWQNTEDFVAPTLRSDSAMTSIPRPNAKDYLFINIFDSSKSLL